MIRFLMSVSVLRVLIYLYVFTNPSARAFCDKRPISF